MPDRAVFYLPTARAQPRGSGESPSTTGQRRICQQAATALRAEVVGELGDDGVSGSTLDRPGLAACLARLDAAPHVDYVVVTDLSRLGRDVPVVAEVAWCVTERGVSLHLAGERRDYVADNGILDLVGPFAQRRPSP